MPCRWAKVRSRATRAALRASFAGQKWSTTHATRAGSNTPLAPIFSNSWIETAPETSLSITRSIRAKANAPGVRSSTPCAARIFADSVIGPSIPSLRSWEVQRTSWTRRGAPREDAGTCVCTSSSWGLVSWGRRSRCGSPRTVRGSTCSTPASRERARARRPSPGSARARPPCATTARSTWPASRRMRAWRRRSVRGRGCAAPGRSCGTPTPNAPRSSPPRWPRWRTWATRPRCWIRSRRWRSSRRCASRRGSSTSPPTPTRDTPTGAGWPRSSRREPWTRARSCAPARR